MKKWMALVGLLALLQLTVQAADFETATQAVGNMKVGWNLGNTLDANGQKITDVSNNGYWGQEGLESEVRWGQPRCTNDLIKMVADAGFGAMRIPVTWYNHMDASGKVDAQWMARVKEVVDYVVGNGLYCILNVHHDTGADGDDRTSWLKADADSYSRQRSRFEYLWRQIAEMFRDYDEHLLFESFNEMLDGYSSWCFATFASPTKYDEAKSKDAYKAINDYAQSFVTTVRNTGGNNAQRNLVVNTYGACCGYGTWNAHLQDPLREMKLPEDPAANHLIFEIHDYIRIADRTMSDIGREIDGTIENLKKYLVEKGVPVIMGEWGTYNVDNGNDYRDRPEQMAQYARMFVEKFKEAGMGTFYWMGLSDGIDRSLLRWTQPEIKNAILKGWYGDDYVIPADPDPVELIYHVTYTGQWTEMNLYSGAELNASDYRGIRVELGQTPAAGCLQIKVYGDKDKYQFLKMTATQHTLEFNSTALGGNVNRITLQYEKTGSYSMVVKGAWLIKKDGTEVETNLSAFWGCELTATAASGINAATGHDAAAASPLYNLQGQRIREPQRGIYIRNGKKYIYQ